MSIYFRPKFKVGQTIFSIEKDKIVQIKVECIQGHSNGVSYLAENRTFIESQSFATLAEAEDFIANAIRIPFVKGNIAWEGSLGGVRPVKVESVNCFFTNNLKKPDNTVVHADNVLNSTCCFENQIEATKFSLNQIEQFKINHSK